MGSKQTEKEKNILKKTCLLRVKSFLFHNRKYFVAAITGFLLGALISSYFSAQLISIMGIVGTIAGIFSGWFISTYDKNKSIIINAQKTLLILSKQLNEFHNIETYFNKHKNDLERIRKTKALLISDSKWRISKNNILGLLEIDPDNEEFTKLIYKLIYLDNDFHTLLFSVEDYNKCREIADDRIRKDNSNNINAPYKLTEIEKLELDKYLSAIDNRIKKLNFQKMNDKLHSQLNKFYPNDKFVRAYINSL